MASEDTSTIRYASGVLAHLLSLVGHVTFIFYSNKYGNYPFLESEENQ